MIKERRPRPAGGRLDRKKTSSVDEEIVDGFAMASFACLRREEIPSGGATAENADMSKRIEEPALCPQKRKALPNKDKSKSKHRRNNVGEANSSDESVGGSSGARTKRPRKKAKRQDHSESQSPDRGYLCDSESEGDVKGCESEQSDQMMPRRMLRPGPGNLNDLFKVAAKERSNLKKQSSNVEATQSRGSTMAMSSPTTVGAPSRAPFQATGTSNPTDSAESRKPVVVPMVHPHFPVPEHMPPEMAAAYMMSHRGSLPLGMPAVSSSYGLLAEQQQWAHHQPHQPLVPPQVQHQHQHHHEHQHHHQHQHQFSLHGPHHSTAPGHVYGGSAVPSPGPTPLPLGLPYGLSGGLPIGNSVPIGVGPSAFQPKKHGKWCAAHGQIAWFIFNHRQHVETQGKFQLKSDAAAAAVVAGVPSNLGVYNPGLAFHPEVPVPGMEMVLGRPMAEAGGRPVMPQGMPDDGHTVPRDAGFLVHPRPHPISIGRPLESEASGTAAVYGSYPGLNMDRDIRPFHPLYSMMPWNVMKKERSKEDETRVSEHTHTKEEKKKSKDEWNAESDRPRSTMEPPSASKLDHVKGSSSAFSSVGGRPSIGSGLGIGAFVNHSNTTPMATQPSSGKAATFSSGVTSTMLNSMKTDVKVESDDKPPSRIKTPKRSSSRPAAASPSSPKRHASHHSPAPPVLPSMMSRRLGFGYTPMQSFSPTPLGHMFGAPGAFMGFPAMGPGGIMMPGFGSQIGMLNMHPSVAAAGKEPHRLVGFEDRSGAAVTKS